MATREDNLSESEDEEEETIGSPKLSVKYWIAIIIMEIECYY